MRGALVYSRVHRYTPGIIPAYAGSTERNTLNRLRMADHPRVCGEHIAALRMNKRVPGIIPAYAGSTGTVENEVDLLEDHPRVCGEHCTPTLD